MMPMKIKGSLGALTQMGSEKGGNVQKVTNEIVYRYLKYTYCKYWVVNINSFLYYME